MTLERTDQKGNSRDDICPRRGNAYLRPNSGTLYVIPTNCKSWSCKACRNRKLGQVVSLMIYGCSHLTEPWLVSLTFKITENGLGKPANTVNAEYAEAAFKEFIRRMRRIPWFPGNEWIRVVEVTEKNQIHFHLIMGKPKIVTQGFRGGNKIRCQKHPDWHNWLSKKCNCIMHQMSRTWYAVTKDSFVVDVRTIYDIEGACWYLAKYLAKAMYGTKRLQIEAKGYKRRYMCSSKWPRGAQMKRLGTLLKAWVDHGFGYGPPNEYLTDWSSKQELMRQCGTDMAKELREANIARGRLKKYRRFKSAANVLA